MSFEESVFGFFVIGPTLILLFLSWSRSRYVLNKKPVRKTTYNFPPGPPPNTIWGHRLPEKNPFLTVESWIKQHGPLISLRGGVSHYVVIGRHKAAMDIMEKRGSALADRPRFVASGELLARGLRLILTPAGERLTRMRRVLHAHLQPMAARRYESLQISHSKETVLGLLESSEQFGKHVHAYSAAVILKLTYGKNTPTQASDPDVLEIQKSLQRLVQSMRPGAYLVDSFPWLKYLPWYGRELRQGFVEDCALYRRQLDAVKLQMDDPDSGLSFARSLLTREIDCSLDETEMAFLAGSMFSGGEDTTASALCIAMTAAARYPDAQAAVHAELDAVVGNDRLPTFGDEKSLPVLRAFILESTRWRPLVPLGSPHRTTEDIIWGDYRIPAGMTVYGNHWSISRDPDVFPDPDSFNLRRWLTLEGDLRNDLKFPYFGFGRRVCPGQHVAVRSLFINIALVLWSFDVSADESKPTDDMLFMRGGIYDVGLHFVPRMSSEKLRMMME